MDLNGKSKGELFDNYNESESSNSKSNRENYINRNLIFSDKYARAIQGLGESKECARKILEIAHTILKHHNGDAYEDLYFIDSQTLEIKYQDGYTVAPKQVEPTKAMEMMLPGNVNIIGIHNHPDSMIPSLSDFHTCEERNYKYGLVLCHNGSIYQYKTIGILNDAIIEPSIHIYEKREYIALMSLQTSAEIKLAHKENLAELQDNLKMAGVDLREVLFNER